MLGRLREVETLGAHVASIDSGALRGDGIGDDDDGARARATALQTMHCITV